MTDVAIPLADTPALHAVGVRTRVLRVALAVTLVAALAAAVLLARGSRVAPAPPLPVGSSGMVVLDLSASIESSKAKRISTALTQLAETNGTFGLVIFTGWAYEALPPGTPARELASVARFFQPQKPPAGVSGYSRFRPFFPRNPWAQAFATGTAISTGLNLARDIVVGSPSNRRSIILISDLADVAADVPLAAAAARSFRDDGIAFHVVGINAALANAEFWQQLMGPGGSFTPAQLPTRQRLSPDTSFPLGLVLVAVLAAVLLALNELWSAPLRWRPRESLSEATA